MSWPTPQQRAWRATCLVPRKTATLSSLARTMTCWLTRLQGTEYLLRSKVTRNILVTPWPSTSSVLNGVSGSGLRRRRLLVLEDEHGHFPGLLVHAPVGEVVAPRGGLRVEVEQIAEAAPGPEAAANEADWPLDASLLVSPSDVAGPHGEAAPGAGVVEKPGIEDGGGGGVREHDGLHVVEDVDGGGAPEEAQAPVHASQEGAHGLADRELDVEMTRVAEDGDERADAPGDAGQREAEVGPVHLHRLARREVERQERLAMSVGSKTPEAVAQDRDAAGVPERAQPLEHGGREHLGRVVEDRADRWLVRIEDRASGLGGRFGRYSMPAEDLADGLSRHAQTLGDRAHGDALDEAETQAPRRRGPRGRAPSLRSDQAKVAAHGAEVADAAQPATRPQRGDCEVELDERAFGGP